MRDRQVNRRVRRGVVVAALLWTAYASRAAAENSLQPAGWDAALKLPVAADLNPDPHIVEINLDARVAEVEVAPGQRVKAWTYNGSVPGPLIRVRTGDRLIVHFSNHLPQASTVHWHGVRVPFAMDGVPGHSQPEVKPGESFTYDFVVPDAGLFWYHPHVQSAAQVGFGLSGALIVDDPADPVGVADELVLVLNDIAIDEDGALEAPDSGGPAGMVFGREGNHVLINGYEARRLVVRAGAPQRWRIVNTSKSRYFELELGNRQPFVKIGGDGGLQEYPERKETVVIGAGERMDLIVTPQGAPGTELLLRSLLFNRGYGSVEYREEPKLINVALADLPPYTGAPVAEVRRSIEPLSQEGATPVDIKFTLAQRTDGEFEYGINGTPFAAGKPILAKPGETQIWTVTNTTKWSHPLHLHGFFFQVLDEHGAPVHPLAWKDTITVPFEKTLRLIVKFDDREGSWMYHCHILDHAEGGLMGMVELGTAHQTHHHTDEKP